MNATATAYRFVHSKKSRIGLDAPSAKAFAWVFGRLANDQDLEGRNGRIEIRHAGTCGRCGRTLTVPQSVDSGLGPTCAGLLGAEWRTRVQAGEWVPLAFMLAGRATFTATSTASGQRFTYRVERAPEREGKAAPWFVSVLTGPENDADYTFLGCVWEAR